MSNKRNNTDISALVHHYAREGYWRHVQTVCEEVLKKRGDDGYLLFWKAYGVAKEGSWTAAIRDWERIKNNRDVSFPAHLALIWAHENTDLTDHEAIDSLSSSLRVAENRATPESVLIAATFSWLTGSIAEARRLVNSQLDDSALSEKLTTRALALRGWIDLTATQHQSRHDAEEGTSSRKEKELANKSFTYFEKALGDKKRASRDLEAIMGKAKYFELKKQYSKALDHLTQAIVVYPWFLPALSGKGKMLMMMGDWDQALETTERVLQQDPYDIEALRISALHSLTRTGDLGRAAGIIDTLITSVDRHEPMNAELCFNVARPLARLSGRDKNILKGTLKLVGRARKLAPMNSLYVTESAQQHVLLGDLRTANDEFKQGASLDDANVQAVTGMIFCQLSAGQLTDAEQQIEFMKEIQTSIGSSYEIIFLSAVIAWEKDRDQERSIAMLDDCMSHFQSALGSGSLKSTYDYFVHFDVDFQLQVARQYMKHCGAEPIDAGEPTPHYLTKALNILARVTKEVPGLLDAQLELAKSKFLNNSFDSAERTLKHCLRLKPTYSDAHLIMAQIAIFQENFRGASNSLEQALAHDFKVRDSPLFYLIKAKVLDGTGDVSGSIEVLRSALKLPSVERAVARLAGGSRGRESKRDAGPSSTLSMHDHASIYIALANVHTKLGQVKDASKVIKTASAIFQGTPEEVRVVVANSELSLKRGKIKRAIAQLSGVKRNSPAFGKAQMVLAKIYLTNMNDKKQYIACYQTMLKINPKPSAHVMLGDAYMNIQEPEKAILSYQDALKMNPNDQALALMIGRAFIKTHEYHRAIEYYEDALEASSRDTSGRNSGDIVSLRGDLARLYIKLKKFDDASRILKQSHDNAEGSSVPDMIAHVNLLLLVAEVKQGMNNSEGALGDLLAARGVQQDILARTRSSDDANAQEQRLEAAKLDYRIGNHHLDNNDVGDAVKFFKNALEHDNSYEVAMLGLAKLYLKQGELQKCQHQCGLLMRIDENHEEAAMMLADIMFQKRENEQAVYHFKQILQRKPNNHKALFRMIVLLRRAGKLEEAPEIMKAAESYSPKSKHDPGLMFCRGLYLRYTNNIPESIRTLNKARKSGMWGEKALINMVELYLNPESDELWEDDSQETGEAVRVAEKLLREITRRPKTRRVLVLEAYALMCTKQKSNIERSVQRFVEMVSGDKEYVPAICGMANALMLLRQVPKARNQLKRIHKMSYNPDYADDFERGWLMLANIYISNGKYDLAQDLCKRCLVYNKSCGKAWEHMGLIMEKESSYRDAAEHYEQAWKCANEANAPIGFKLAFNYLKAERFLDAIRVCHKILSKFPDYPKIKSDILKKAREGLRP
jgi:tetratricopeptide repeat protein 21B